MRRWRGAAHRLGVAADVAHFVPLRRHRRLERVEALQHVLLLEGAQRRVLAGCAEELVEAALEEAKAFEEAVLRRLLLLQRVERRALGGDLFQEALEHGLHNRTANRRGMLDVAGALVVC